MGSVSIEEAAHRSADKMANRLPEDPMANQASYVRDLIGEPPRPSPYDPPDTSEDFKGIDREVFESPKPPAPPMSAPPRQRRRRR